MVILNVSIIGILMGIKCHQNHGLGKIASKTVEIIFSNICSSSYWKKQWLLNPNVYNHVSL